MTLVRVRRVTHLFGVVLVLAVVGLFLVAAFPGVVGADESFVVQSSSMSPAIKAGSVVFVSDVPMGQLTEGDIITYSRVDGGMSQRVTHRIVDVFEEDTEMRFRTKGDANEEADRQLVTPRRVVGKVIFHVPLIGYVIAFAQSSTGLVTLVVVPALVLLALEVRDLFDPSNGETENANDSTTPDTSDR